ncbi:M13 family metallopeptidase [Sphingomicrobium marinum]|uniref:M13 family metallopeptidase n=1 Tax=Sphingomicrobium marinum TaxID=1227950 RepID=UPI00223F41F2|nr:M13 family metallopeptidase [Sphingomicrobium marinum]
MSKFVTGLLATTMLAMPAMAQDAANDTETRITAAAERGNELGTFGFETTGMDLSVDPGDDFYAYANGTWAANTEIPSDKSNYSMFGALDDLSQKRTRVIIEEEAADPESRIGALYRSYMDVDAINAKGLEPIQDFRASLAEVSNLAEYAAFLGDNTKYGVGATFAPYVGQDDKDPTKYMVKFWQAGLGMPDRDYYLEDNDRMKGFREAYLAYITDMMTMAGEENAAQRAANLIAFETKLADAHWSRVQSRDSNARYNKMSVAELQALTGDFDIVTLLDRAGYPTTGDVIVAQPDAFQKMGHIVADTDIQVLKDLVLMSTLTNTAAMLPSQFDERQFAFYGTTLSGTPEQQERWKRAVAYTVNTLTDEVSAAYVAKYYPPETEAEMQKLVDNVIDAMGKRIDGVAWMQPETKQRARAKLLNFTTKIGYPSQWQDYSDIEITEGDLIGTSMSAAVWAHNDALSKLGSPIRRWEWGMTPMTVNAYANFGMQEIVFPASILQPPFFDPDADPAINYGAIGAVIGHEISHHFDDQGAKYNERGELDSWWTDEDVAAFTAAGKRLVDQYNQYEIFDGEYVDGEYTLGENIGDLAGLAIAYDAYKASLNGEEAPVIDGTTGDQRFFLGWAQVWRRNYRDEELKRRLKTDSHSPSIQRVWVIRNIDAWYDAFDVSEDDAMYLPPEERVKVW